MEKSVNDNIKIAAFCAASEAYDKNERILDSLEPLVIVAMGELANNNDVQTLAFDEIKRTINEIYSISINSSMLNRLLKHLKEKSVLLEYCRYKTITVDHIIDTAEIYKSEGNDLSDFFVGFSGYLKEKGIRVDFDEVKRKVCSLVLSRSTDLADFFKKNATKEDLIQQNDDIYIVEFLDYLLLCEEKSEDKITAFRQLYNGAVQASLLGVNPDTVEAVAEQPFKIKKVVLDTNFIIRLLGLQTEIENKLARELWGVLKENGTKFEVLSTTIEEIQNSIKRFVEDITPYTSGTRLLKNHEIKSCGYLSAYRAGIVSKTDFEYLTHSANIIRDLQTKWDCVYVENKYFVKEEQITDIQNAINFDGLRDGYSRESAIQDLELMEHCKASRRAEKTYNNTAQGVLIWVLTEDYRLCKYSMSIAKETQTCISEAQLSNLLWLSRHKECKGALVNVIVSLATPKFVTAEKYMSFLDKMIKYKEKFANNPEALDSIALVLASEAISTNDIIDIANGSVEIDSLLFEESEKVKECIEKQRKEQDNKLEKVSMDLLLEKDNSKSMQEENLKLQKAVGVLEEKNKERAIEAKERDINDLDHLTQKMKDIDNKSDIWSVLLFALQYLVSLVIIIGIGVVVCRQFGILGKLSTLITREERYWDFFMEVSRGIISLILVSAPLCLMGVWGLIRKRGFSIEPKTLLSMLKESIALKKARRIVQEYDWIWVKLGKEQGFGSKYDEKGISSINKELKDLIEEINFEISKLKE